MSLSTPTVQQVSDNVLAQVESSISQTVPLLPKAFVRVLAKAIAGVFILLWKYAGWIFLQQFVSEASWQETTINGKTVRPLVEWGRLIGLGDPTPATRAELVVDVTVTEQTGALPAGSQLLRSSTGVVYVTVAAVALDAPTVQVTIRAASDQQGGGGEGAIGNLDPGDTLSFASPLANVARDVTVVSQAVTASDAETEESYRRRVVERFQRRPQGGAYADFRDWGQEPVGIVRVYPYTGLPGEIDIYVEATEASSGSPDGIPTAAQLTAVTNAINANEDGLATRRAAGQAINVHAITRLEFDVEISGLDAVDATTAQDTIRAALDEHLRSREPFIVGLSVLPRRDRVSEAALGGVAEEAANALGATLNTLELELSAAPITAYTLDNGQKAKLGTLTFI